MRRLSWIAALVALSAPAVALAQQNNQSPRHITIKEARPGLAAEAVVSGDSAVALARAKVPNGRIVSAELEQEGGALIYSFDIRVPHHEGITELHVNAKTGAIAPLEHESGDDEGD